MRAGELDRRIVIQTNTPVADATGEPVESWGTLATVWAKFEPLRGVERFAAEQVHAELDAKFTIRHRTDVGPKQRISWDGETWDIEAALEFGRRAWLQLLCSAKRDD